MKLVTYDWTSDSYDLPYDGRGNCHNRKELVCAESFTSLRCYSAESLI